MPSCWPCQDFQMDNYHIYPSWNLVQIQLSSRQLWMQLWQKGPEQGHFSCPSPGHFLLPDAWWLEPECSLNGSFQSLLPLLSRHNLAFCQHQHQHTVRTFRRKMLVALNWVMLSFPSNQTWKFHPDLLVESWWPLPCHDPFETPPTDIFQLFQTNHHLPHLYQHHHLDPALSAAPVSLWSHWSNLIVHILTCYHWSSQHAQQRAEWHLCCGCHSVHSWMVKTVCKFQRKVPFHHPVADSILRLPAAFSFWTIPFYHRRVLHFHSCLVPHWQNNHTVTTSEQDTCFSHLYSQFSHWPSPPICRVWIRSTGEVRDKRLNQFHRVPPGPFSTVHHVFQGDLCWCIWPWLKRLPLEALANDRHIPVYYILCACQDRQQISLFSQFQARSYIPHQCVSIVLTCQLQLWSYTLLYIGPHYMGPHSMIYHG